MTSAKLELPINIVDVMKHLPHRYPFLLVDRVLELVPGKSISALKNVTINEPHFMGHFAEYPIMPGVLIIEALAQAAGVLTVVSFGARQDNEIYFFAGINEARFKRQVIPGDSLVLQAELIKSVRGVSKFKARALVGDVVAAETELLIAKKEI